MIRPAHLVAGAVALAAAALAAFPPADFPAGGAQGAALGLAVIGLLATGALPEHVTTVLFFTVAMLLAIAPPEVIFAGFSSTAFWLVFGGLVIGVGVRCTGLAERLAHAIAARLGTRYAAVIGGTVAMGVAFAFLMPSTMGRTLILLPIVLAMAEGLGFGEGRRGRTGMALAAGFGTMLPAFTILPATVPAMVLSGASEALYDVSPVYGEYLLLHFPVLGFLKAIVIAAAVVWLFPDHPKRADRPAAGGPRQPMSGQERLMALLLALALLLWITDFLHHVSPAWVALAAAAVCLLPATALVSAQAFNEKINYGSLFYVAGVLGLGALIAHSGTGDYLAHKVLALLDLRPGEYGWAFMAVTGLGTMMAMLATQPAVPVVLTPLSGEIAQAAGLPIEAVLMMQVVGFSTVVLPYQAPPLVVTMQLGGVRTGDGNKLCLAVLAVTVAVLIPLDFLWWRLLGWFG